MEPFVGEIMMFGGNFAPRGWAFCDGQILAVSQNEALFSLLGTIYGGDGAHDLRAPGPARSGAPSSGQRTRADSASDRPAGRRRDGAAHRQSDRGPQPPPERVDQRGQYHRPGPAQVLAMSNPVIYKDGTATAALNAAALGQRGGSSPHPNVMPFQCVNFCISLFGVYPSRN